MPANSLRFLSLGAGAIGTYIGSSLILAGYPVVFLEQPSITADLRQRGLRMRIKEQELLITQPQIASSLEEALALGPFDAAIFALKSFDTQALLDQVIPFRDNFPPILCLQNGVDNEPVIASALSSDQVIAGTVTSAIGRKAAGDVTLERKRGVGIAAGHPRSSDIVFAFQQAGLNAHLYTNALDMKWSKLLTNLLANATSAILGMPPTEIFTHPGLYCLEIEQLRETIRVMTALNIRAVNLPATPVRALAFCVLRLPVWLSRPLLQRAIGGGRGGKMPSFYLDLHSIRGKTEVDFLNGAVVRHGILAGVPTPVNQLLNETLLALTNGEEAIEDYLRQPDKLLSRKLL